MRLGIVILLIFSFNCYSQKTLNIYYRSIFGKQKVFQFFNNHVFYYKCKGKTTYQANKIVNMNDSLVLFDNNTCIKYSDIKAVKVPGIKLNYIFYNSALGFLESEIFYHYMVNTSKVVTEQGAIVTAVLVVGGVVASFIQDKHIKIKKSTLIKFVDSDFQNINRN
jgi:hypothetical protein